MLCFTLTLEKKQTPYQLSQLIAEQYPDETISNSWRRIRIEANVDNKANIKFGCFNLSGLRYGRVLTPGQPADFQFGFNKYVGTDDKYLMCEEKDRQGISVECD